MINLLKRTVLPFLFVALFIVINSKLNSQLYLENWKNYTSFLNVKTAAIDSKGRIWAGTLGGVFCFDPGTKEFKTFTNTEGLYSLQVSIIQSDTLRKQILIGCYDGNLDIISEDFVWRHITDIKNSKFTEPQINDIKIDGDIAYVAGGFGLTLFSLKDYVFLKTPPQLGSFSPGAEVKTICLLNNDLWAGTKFGIARVNLKKSIIDPDNWVNYTAKNGLTETAVNYLAVLDDTLFVGMNRYIVKFASDSFSFVDSTDVWTSLTGLERYKNRIVYSTYFISKGLDRRVFYEYVKSSDSALINGIYADQNTMLVFLKNSGVVFVNNDTTYFIKPNSPSVSNMISCAVSTDGTLWCATGTDASGFGFMSLENGVWTNYFNKKISALKTDAYYQVNSDDFGNVIVSSWGGGFVQLKKKSDSYNLEHFDSTNSPLLGVVSNQHYIVTGQSATDKRNGIIWIDSYGQNSPGPLLVAREPDGTFHSFENYFNTNNREYLPLVVDDNGTKWLGSNSAYGLYYFNENGTFDNKADDKYGTYNSANSNLPSNIVNSLTVDKTGVIWIGTPVGLAAILNPSSVLRNQNPIIRKVSLISTQYINDIYVDALNYKWVATNAGVWVINADGSEVIGSIDNTNSPILSNEVLSIASDQSTGRLYFSTKQGVTAVNSLSVKPLGSYDIRVFPQPYIPETDPYLSIEGLTDDTGLAICTTSGQLIRKISTTSRKAVWDGKNEMGELVSSGIYLIVASSSSKDATAVAKFALVRK